MWPAPAETTPSAAVRGTKRAAEAGAISSAAASVGHDLLCTWYINSVEKARANVITPYFLSLILPVLASHTMRMISLSPIGATKDSVFSATS